MALTMDQLNAMTADELYALGRSNVALLNKRLKRLEQNVRDKPGEYSTHGLKKLKGETSRPGGDSLGIPTISKKDHLNTLKSKVKYSEHLKDLKTTTSTGAKKVQSDQIKQMIGVPRTGRLNAKDQKKYNEARDYAKQNPEALSEFWEAFEEYQENMRHLGQDSDRRLEELREIREQAQKDGYTTMSDLKDYVREMSSTWHEETAKRDDMDQKLTDESGWEEGNW